MKNVVVYAVCATMMLAGCDTYAGAGAYTGSTLGSILGSAIGGLSDGPRGSDIGTIIGMAGGAIIGGAIGNAADQRAEQQEVNDHYQRVQQRRAQDQSYQNGYQDGYQNGTQNNQVSGSQSGSDDSGLDSTNSGDDRIYDFTGKDYTGNYSAQQPKTTLPGSSSVEDLTGGYKYTPSIEIRNARFVDDNQDNVISRGELCKVIFEVINRGNETLYDVQPTVVEATGNRHIFISPGIHVEKILPGKGIRYTALVKADNSLKDGSAKICVSVVQANKAISKVSEFNVPTRK
jgi:hypothetical protein